MIQYISKIQRAFIDQHGFAEQLDRPGLPVNVPDGEYPIVIDGRLDMVEIEDGLIGCCNFNTIPNLRAKLAEKQELPMEATCAMVDGLARQIVMWWGFNLPTGKALYEHLRCGGTKYPEWLKTDIPDIDHVPPKGCVAAVLWRVMAEAYVASVKEQK